VIARGATTYLGDCDSDGLCVLSKTSDDYDDVIIIINNSEESCVGDISSFITDDAEITYELLANDVTSHGELKGGVITVPPYGIIVVK
ncbi:MAG: hypothetical protein K6E64_07325, partial [Lachnospiraceae bacterium]|nr:hypothetical protein [Lachnospiraceae bacterium]